MSLKYEGSRIYDEHLRYILALQTSCLFPEPAVPSIYYSYKATGAVYIYKTERVLHDCDLVFTAIV